MELSALLERLKDASSPESVAVAALRADAGGLVTRFAPSPTGHLHDGHLLHIRWLWEVAGVVGAEIVVRMEDHDRGRCRPEYETSILDDLAALGRSTAHPSLASLRTHPSPWRQSDHPERYQAAFDQLNAAGLLYGCTCTRGDLPPQETTASAATRARVAVSRSKGRAHVRSVCCSPTSQPKSTT